MHRSVSETTNMNREYNVLVYKYQYRGSRYGERLYAMYECTLDARLTAQCSLFVIRH